MRETQDGHVFRKRDVTFLSLIRSYLLVNAEFVHIRPKNGFVALHGRVKIPKN